MIHCVNLNATLDHIFSLASLDLGAVQRASSCVSYPGGKGSNVARGVARLGGRARLVAFCGRGEAAGLRAWYQAEGVQAALLPVAGGQRPCLILREEGRQRETVVNSPSRISPTPAQLRSLQALLLGGLRPGDLAVFSGTLPQGMPKDSFSRLISAAQERRALALFDSSGPGLTDGLAARPFMVKPNLEELEDHLGRPLRRGPTLRRAMEGLKLEGIHLVVVTLGAGGARAVASGQAFAVNAPPARRGLASPVGCGDAFLSGMAWALDKGEGLFQALRWATAAAWANLGHAGAGFMTREEVSWAMGKVRVKPWKGAD